jgi:hypothetical protein
MPAWSVFEVASAASGVLGVSGLISFLRGRAGRLAVLNAGVSFAKLRFVSICTMTGASICVSLLSKAVWVKRLARWVGAGGNGMNEGL